MRHAIIRIELADPDGVRWWCQCGDSGICPNQVTGRVLHEHLEGR